MDTFEVGEIALYYGPIAKWHGTEVSIETCLHQARLTSDVGESHFAVAHDICGNPSPPERVYGWRAETSSLRKLPPQNTTTSWDTCVFRPKALARA